MNWPAYPEHKYSGVEWLGHIPSHWSVPRLGHVSTCLDSLRIPLNSSERADVPGDVPYWGANGVVGWVDRPLVSGQVVLLGEDGAPFFDRLKDKAFFVDKPIWPNNHIHVLRTRTGISGRYLTHALNATDYSSSVEGSTRDKLTQGDMKSIPVLLPPHNEQKAIVAFLTRETGKIDALIDKQHQLIATLREDRTATITHAVTEGLNPNAEMKDSGVEWIGLVPAAWPITEIKQIHEVKLGKMLKTEPSSTADALQPYLRAAHIPPRGFTTVDAKTMWFSPKERSDLTLRKGDVVVVEGGMGGYGRCDMVPDDLPGWGFQNSINRLRRTDGTAGAFTKYVLQMAREWGFIDVLCSISTMPHLTAEKLGEMRIPDPTFSERNDIVDYLDKVTVRIDELVAKTSASIDMLREYRSALITAAVTGKIDVRGAA